MRNLSLESNLPPVVYDYIYKEIFEEQLYSFCSKENEPIILDCGSNIGLSVIFFKELFPNSTIFAFEPDIQTFYLLKKNVESKSLTKVTLINKAISNQNGFIDFYPLQNRNSPPVMSLIQNDNSAKSVKVESIDFADFIKNFDYISLSKIDIEGGESYILESLLNANLLYKVKVYIIEYHHWVRQKYSLEEFIHIFEVHNYKTIILKEEPSYENWPSSGNTVLRFELKNIVK
jgi:FkbM family methyltransferase